MNPRLTTVTLRCDITCSTTGNGEYAYHADLIVTGPDPVFPDTGERDDVVILTRSLDTGSTPPSLNLMVNHAGVQHREIGPTVPHVDGRSRTEYHTAVMPNTDLIVARRREAAREKYRATQKG